MIIYKKTCTNKIKRLHLQQIHSCKSIYAYNQKRKTLIDFYIKKTKAKEAIEDWFSKTKSANWTCFADVKKTFNSVDSVGHQHYVFNIKGNDYRLVAVIKFTIANVLIRFIGTHKEYDKIRDIQNI